MTASSLPTVLSVSNLCASASGRPILHNVSFDVPQQAYVCIQGASGCGKSTLLRCLAGLHTPDSGSITLGATTLYRHAPAFVSLSPAERGVSMVFQNYALWPHMTVLENVLYPLRASLSWRKKRDAHTKTAHIERALDWLQQVGLRNLSERFPQALSGGQQQRVALARAMVTAPAAVLLDEPLANLDAQLRFDMIALLRRTQREQQSVFIHVTHDRDEASQLATHLLLLDGGRLEQYGPTDDVYAHPRTANVAARLHEGLTLRVVAAEQGRVSVRDAQGQTWLAVDNAEGQSDLVISQASMRPVLAQEQNVRHVLVAQLIDRIRQRDGELWVLSFSESLDRDPDARIFGLRISAAEALAAAAPWTHPPSQKTLVKLTFNQHLVFSANTRAV